MFPSIRVFSSESVVHIKVQPENKTKDSGVIIQLLFVGVLPTGQLLATGQIYDGGPWAIWYQIYLQKSLKTKGLPHRQCVMEPH